MAVNLPELRISVDWCYSFAVTMVMSKLHNSVDWILVVGGLCKSTWEDFELASVNDDPALAATNTRNLFLHLVLFLWRRFQVN